MKVKKAVIPAAGLGTRFLPATKAQPKEMLPIVDKPTIQYVVEEAVAAGIEEILIITGRNKRAIEDHFDYCVELEITLERKGKLDELKKIRHISEMAEIFYVRQKEPLGLGHAIGCAGRFVKDEPFAILLGDDIIYSDTPVIKQLIDVFHQKESSVIGVQPVSWESVHKYGVVDAGGENGPTVRVKSLVEKPHRGRAPSNLAVLGRYVIEPGIFPILDRTKPGAGGEIQLTDALNELAQIRPVWAHTFQGRRYDVGDRLGFLEATIEYALRRDDLSANLYQFLDKALKNRHPATK
jgi:UTP--glucose-1-phosphate uridylyltransferase